MVGKKPIYIDVGVIRYLACSGGAELESGWVPVVIAKAGHASKVLK